MLTAADPREEERAAREALRRAQRLNRARARKAEQKARAALRAALVATGRRYPSCRCDLSGSMDWGELRRLPGCQSRYVCPRLDAIRRAVL